MNEMSAQKVTQIVFIESAIDSTFMRNAFQSIQTNEWMTKTWIHFNHLNQLQTIDVNNDVNNDLFVINSFDGKTYEDLIERKARIISPLTILYWHSNHSNDSKKWQSFCDFYLSIAIKSYPIFSQCMNELIVCMSFVESNQKLQLIEMIERMSGVYSSQFTPEVTHLVTNSLRTEKYSKALSIGTTIVSTDWVTECWRKYQYMIRDANHQTIVDEFTFPSFPEIVHKNKTQLLNGFVISVSQLETKEVKRIEKIIQNNGGLFSCDLKSEDNLNESLLLLKEPNGQQFETANKLNVECLHIKWLFESVLSGYLLPKDNFRISGIKPMEPLNAFEGIEWIENCESNVRKGLFESVLSDYLLPKDNLRISGIKPMEPLNAFEGIEWIESCESNVRKGLFESVLSGHLLPKDDLRISSIKLLEPINAFEGIEWIENCEPNVGKDINKRIIDSSLKKTVKTRNNEQLFKVLNNLVVSESKRKCLEKLKKANQNNKQNHKSLGEDLNEKTTVEWNYKIDDELPSQRPYNCNSFSSNMETNNQRIPQINDKNNVSFQSELFNINQSEMSSLASESMDICFKV